MHNIGCCRLARLQGVVLLVFALLWLQAEFWPPHVVVRHWITGHKRTGGRSRAGSFGWLQGRSSLAGGVFIRVKSS